ncbi:MAG: holo-ACP synthase [Planctomycetota bacterium]|jgi:holo-[acyl-carrier protein] synthase
MATKGIGIDAVEVQRIRALLAERGRAFKKKVFTRDELGLFEGAPDAHIHVAGRFAAKEAVLKVLGTGWGQGVHWRDVEVLADGDGVPVVHLHGKAEDRARLLGIQKILLSITHTADLAMATALGE